MGVNFRQFENERKARLIEMMISIGFFHEARSALCIWDLSIGFG
jgi:hypothetical protein